MASQHHFSDLLRSQLNEYSNARNLQLQALLAQRDDALAACNTRLQNAIDAATTDVPDGLLQSELRVAKEAASSAEMRLIQTFAVFNQKRSELKQQIKQLRGEVAERDAVLSDAGLCLEAEVKRSATIPRLNMELASTQTELERMKQFANGIQKQYEAEKMANASRYPATAIGKNCTDVNQDDDEIVDDDTRIKQELASGARSRRSDTQTAPPPRQRRSSPVKSHKNWIPDLATRPSPTQIIRGWQAEPSTPLRSKPRSRARHHKRKRSSLEDEDADYDDLEINMDDFGGNSARKRSQTTRGREIEHMKKTFGFKAITSYDNEGDKLYLDSKQDLSDVCPELWECIQRQHEAWERASGEEWLYDIESKYTVSVLAKPGTKPPCVTTKLLKINNGKANWRPGHEGKYACRECATETRPCFIWDGEELYLLPLHKEDRIYPEEDGFEIRTWLDIE